ncbi:hypothetical protein DL96DRAFT_1565745 [Flagelloscypha sp. PMI_526]|nr:hypothetical protein DL96DRAFT_1565745 [Flagelloscypha sp. PMI_526]
MNYAQNLMLDPPNNTALPTRNATSSLKLPLAILSLARDGSPWKSLGPLSQIAILDDVLSSYKLDRSPDGDNSDLCDVFDMIIGTGTGGMSIAEARHTYIKFYESAFRPEPRTKSERADDLRHALEDLLDQQSPRDADLGYRLSCAKMEDIEKLGHKCKFAVTAMASANTSSPTLVRGYRGRSPSIDCTVLNALLATLSDVATFLPVEIQNEKFISANLGHLNPAEDLLKEVRSIYRLNNISTVVSIGPGRPPPISVHGLGGFAKALQYYAEDCQTTSDRLKARFSRHPALYFRFEVDTLDIEPLDLQVNPTSWGTVISHSRVYLGREGVGDQLYELAHTLIDRPSRLKVSQLSGLEVSWNVWKTAFKRPAK